MNSKCRSRIRVSLWILCFQAPLFCQSGDHKFEISPHIKGLAAAKDGFLEAGPVIYSEDLEIHPYIRLPITDKERSLVQIDQSTNNLNLGMSVGYVHDSTKECGPIRRWYLTGQLEGGFRQYTFYPDSTASSETEKPEWYFSGEVKLGYFWTKGKPYARHWNPEFRLRYTRNVSEAEETGIVMNHPNGISTVENRIIQKPEIIPSLSPAVALSYYPGKGKFSYTPAVYYYFTGEEGKSNPFGHTSRLRIESWIYYYPVMTGYYVKIGLSPFISARISGEDSREKILYGVLVQLLVDKNRLRFF